MIEFDDFQEISAQTVPHSAFELDFEGAEDPFKFCPAQPAKPYAQNFDQWETNLGKILDLDAIGALDPVQKTPQPTPSPASFPSSAGATSLSVSPQLRQPPAPSTRTTLQPPEPQPTKPNMFDSMVKSATEMMGIKPPLTSEQERMNPDHTADNLVTCQVDDYQPDKRTYRVSSQPKGTSSVLALFQGKLCSVRRKVSDFEWFHNHLMKKYPQYLIPPIGETKGRVGEYMASEDYPQQQARKFTTFLQRLGRHITLAKSDEFKRFISLSSEDWSKEKSAKHEYPQISQGWFSSAPPITDERILAAYNEIIGFKEYMKVLMASAHALEQSYKNLNQEYIKWNAQLSKLSALPSIVKPTTGWESMVLIERINDFSNTFVGEATTATEIGNSMSLHLEERILSWVDYARSAQQLLERYALVESNYNSALASFQRRKQRLGVCTQAGNLASSEGQSILKLVQEAEQVLAKQSIFYNSVQMTVWDELRHYDRMKAAELNHWISHFADTQDLNHSQIIKAWQKIVHKPTTML